jgi:predicted O-methyltransferase YrrM
MDAYSTHLPILEKIAKIKKLKKVLEFGPGQYSTTFFVDHCKEVMCIEQQNHAVANILYDKYDDEDHKGVVIDYMPGAGRGPAWLRQHKGRFDLIFVDGHGRSRPLCINEAFNHTDIIVAHDTEDLRYSWENVDMPKGWKKIEFTKLTPATTVWTKDPELIKKLKA